MVSSAVPTGTATAATRSGSAAVLRRRFHAACRTADPNASATASAVTRAAASQYGLLRFRVEQVQAPHVDAELDLVADEHLEVRVHPGDHLVAADLAVQVLIGAE